MTSKVFKALVVLLAGTASVMSWTTPMPTALDPLEMEVKNIYDDAKSSRSPIDKRGLYGLGYHNYAKNGDLGYGGSALQAFKDGSNQVNEVQMVTGPTFGQALEAEQEHGSGSEIRSLGLSDFSGPRVPRLSSEELPQNSLGHQGSPNAYTFFEVDPMVHHYGPTAEGHHEVAHGPETDEFIKNLRLSYEGPGWGRGRHLGAHEEDFKGPLISEGPSFDFGF